ncbi:DUF3618 domain-containing protein [Salinactinospora qingdaonensis]|uniref:DUF3618 domain-containing protein n=1 Tax=Salinactinospora qingdaonensis TaxID=702744 RepID=A0ABP7GF76_9ACTN
MDGRDPGGARRDPAIVQAEIERAQQRLVVALDEIVDRTSPKRVARRQWQHVRDSGGHLLEEVRALIAGEEAVRVDRSEVEPSEGAVMLKGDSQAVSTYRSRGAGPPAAVVAGVGAGVAVAVGAVVLWRRRRRR